MRHLHVATAIIRKDNIYYFQLRNGNASIGAAGLIGSFGGKIEPGETAAQAVCREISEETSLSLSAERFKYLGNVDVVSDHNNETVSVKLEVFELDLGTETLEAKEGELVPFLVEELEKNVDQLTSGTRACFKKFIQEK
ncbi:NUDIX domain-containing protein [Candidatus Saccharibacteria bacterium]|jgi:8-oxo-dGTP pyrophosphatase MutT (NUDIX family)|nr:NUDIX domain-containing protein [Candidatus Saccharibacteria bacterium]